MDLGGEALGSYKARQGGCTQIQVSVRLLVYQSDSEYRSITITRHSSSTSRQEISSERFFSKTWARSLMQYTVTRCTNSECGMEFSKASLQDNAYIQIQGLPA
jgi:hypothetical protein